MWKKCCVGWEGLNIFNNRITFLCTGRTDMYNSVIYMGLCIHVV